MRRFHLSKVDRGGLSRDRHSRWLEALIDLNARASVLLQRLDGLACMFSPYTQLLPRLVSVSTNTSTDQWCRAR